MLDWNITEGTSFAGTSNITEIPKEVMHFPLACLCKYTWVETRDKLFSSKKEEAESHYSVADEKQINVP